MSVVRDKKSKPIQDYALAALCQTLGVELGIPAPQLDTSDSWSGAYSAAEAGKRTEISGLRIDTVTRLKGDDPRAAAGAFRAYALQSSGLMAPAYKVITTVDGVKTTNNYRVTIVPVRYQMTLMFGSFDMQRVLKFVTDWHFTGAKDRASFELSFLGQQLPVTVVLGDDVSMPPKSSNGEDSRPVSFECQIEVFSYLSSEDVRDKRAVPVVLDTTLTTYMEMPNG